MQYKQAMEYINKVGMFGSNYGLERTYRILEILGSPQNNIKIIHVAGTNGKGSITAMITSLLREYGFKVGMYTSPFLEVFEERIQINNTNIPKEVLGELVGEVKNAVDTVVSEGYSHPTEFEIITCLMFLYFSNEKVDYAVVEVGLGGKLDSTNVITPILSVIASISFDHMALLGNTLSEIASEKAGIIKENTPVVIYPQEKEAYEVIKQRALLKNSELIEADKKKCELVSISNKNRFYQTVKVELGLEKFEVELPLLGEHQIINMITALTAFKKVCSIENLKFDTCKVKAAIAKVKWIGRLEVLNNKPLIVIDGAHNIQGIKALKKNVQKYFEFNNIYLLIGILADKKVKEMINEIVPIAKKVYALTPHSDRAQLAEDLKKEIVKVNSNCVSYQSYKEAIEEVLKEAEKNDLILISGSLYLIGDIRKIIKNLKFKI